MRKESRIEIRVDSFEKKLLKIKASEAGLNLSDYIRFSALNRKIYNRSEKIIEAYLLLQKYQDNFRRISNLFKNGNYPMMHKEILEVREEIMKHLKSIEDDK